LPGSGVKGMYKGLEVVLETASPVHIGNGSRLSPYGGYVFDEKDGIVYILDPDKVDKALNRLPEKAVDEYVEILTAQKRTPRNFYLLKNFFSQWKIRYQDLAMASVRTDANIKNEEIHQMIKSGTRPYIPGSSIKGAIRTALIYSHLKEGGYTVEQALSTINKPRGFYNGSEIFGVSDKDILKYLHVSDTNLLAPDEVGIVKTVRFHLKKKKTGIPITKEVIPEKKKLYFRLQTKADASKNLHENFSYLYSREDFQGEKDILYRVNQFTKDLLESELDLFKRYISGMNGLISFYEKLLAAAKTFEKEKNGAVMRIGSGKTFYDNTVTKLLSDREIQKIAKSVFKKVDHPFPVERTVIDGGNLFDATLGWVFLHIKLNGAE